MARLFEAGHSNESALIIVQQIGRFTKAATNGISEGGGTYHGALLYLLYQVQSPRRHYLLLCSLKYWVNELPPVPVVIKQLKWNERKTYDDGAFLSVCSRLLGLIDTETSVNEKASTRCKSYQKSDAQDKTLREEVLLYSAIGAPSVLYECSRNKMLLLD